MKRGLRLTPEGAQALVAKHGSQAAAARALGVAGSTFRYWLDPEPQRERMREKRADPEYRNRELDQQIERYANLSGFAYTHRRHQIDMAARRRRIKRRKERLEGMRRGENASDFSGLIRQLVDEIVRPLQSDP